MDVVRQILAMLSVLLALVSCGAPPVADNTEPGPDARRITIRRLSAVIVTKRESLRGWNHREFKGESAPGDADGGSAVPVTPDGYFLTASHVVAAVDGRNIFVVYGADGNPNGHKARLVWRSDSADIALLKIDAPTPDYYQWTPRDQWLPVGTRVIHGGISTGLKSSPGKLNTALPPDSRFSRSRKFKLDIPFQPGDSGGPVVDAYGRLVGINSAVEFIVPMETAFFVDSEANRPNLDFLESLIRGDRERKTGGGRSVD